LRCWFKSGRHDKITTIDAIQWTESENFVSNGNDTKYGHNALPPGFY